MKWLQFSLVLVLFGCVPLKEYKAQKSLLAELTLENKNIRKEIRTLQKEERLLADTISAREARNAVAAKSMKKRLEDADIKVRISPDKISGISIRKPDEDKDFYNSMWRSYKSRDTHSARNTQYLSKSEREIYYYLNWARLNPKDFCKKFVLPKLKYDSQNVYILSLIDYMMHMGPRNALVPDRTQFDNARCHAISSGKLGYVGHQRQSTDCKSGFGGECCSYGVSDPLSVVLQLLIDYGVTSLGHRYICLGWYEQCGISMQPHTGYGTNVVLDFR